MPSISDIQNSKGKPKFKKREYRSWNMEGVVIPPNPNNIILETGSSKKSSDSSQSVLSINTKEIKNWKFHDRPTSELGDIESLAKEFLDIGQHQPCVVRPSTDAHYKYELIAGERRWRAADKAGLNVKVIVNDLSDHNAALLQASENSNRKDLSDFAKGMSYARLIESCILSQKDLIDKLHISKQRVSRFLSFSKIPPKVLEAIGDFSKISAGTAERIKQLCDKGENYIEAILSYASSLRDGAIGHAKLGVLVEKHVNADSSRTLKAKKVFSTSGRLLFTWRKEKNTYFSINFPKDITTLIDNEKVSLKTIDKELKTLIEGLLMKIHS